MEYNLSKALNLNLIKNNFGKYIVNQDNQFSNSHIIEFNDIYIIAASVKESNTDEKRVLILSVNKSGEVLWSTFINRKINSFGNTNLNTFIFLIS